MHEYKAPITTSVRAAGTGSTMSSSPAAGFEEVHSSWAEAVLEEDREIRGGVLSPLNRRGESRAFAGTTPRSAPRPGGSKLRPIRRRRLRVRSLARVNSAVRTFRAPLSALVEEMWNAANMAFTLCPDADRGAIEAIELKGSERQKQPTYRDGFGE